MSNEKIIKYAVLSNNCKNHSIDILFVTPYEHEAIDFLSKYIINNFELDAYLKAYYENDKSICIYKYYYFHPKELIFKFQIINFSDPLLCK
jgi:hypothetical protein